MGTRLCLHEELIRSYRTDDVFLSVDEGRDWTFGELDDLAGRMAAVLADAGARPGERVLVQVAKSAEAVALYLACIRTGAMYVPVNDAYTPAEMAGFLQDTEPVVAVTDPRRMPDDTTRSLSLAADGSGSLAAAALHRRPLSASAAAVGDEPAAMLFTSGTTGRPKGAVLTSAGLVANARTLRELWGYRHGDVVLHTLPIFHAHGLFVSLHTAMLNGSRLVLQPRFDVERVLARLPECTVMMGVPTHYHRLLADERFDEALCRHVRLFTSGSAPLTGPVFAAMERRTGHRILERYGMTETLMITSNPLDGERVAGTVGFALPEVELRVADDAGVPCPPDVAGSVQVRGPSVFTEYWRRPEVTAACRTDDGFFVTGDLGSLDNSGRLTLTGRSSDLIISGGYNISPAEIESHLEQLDGVSECAVVGVGHHDLGEVPAAFVVPLAGHGLVPSELLAALSERLARFKVPRSLRVVEALPRNAMGKIDKLQLRGIANDVRTGVGDD